MQITIHHRNSTRHEYKSEAIEKVLKQYLQDKVNVDKLELSVWAVGKQRIRQLNEQFRQKMYPTDVLSFTGFTQPHLPILNLGEIVFCPSIVNKQAQEFGLRYEDELALYLRHSIDHLLDEYHNWRVNDQNKHHRRP